MAKQEKTGIDIIENAEVLKKEFFKFEDVFEKNKKLLSIIGGVIVGIVALYFAYNYYTETQEKEAQAAMSDAVFSFEADSLNQALKGQGGNEGLLAIAENYSSTKAGKLANLYVGIIYMKQAKFKEAIEKLDNFSADDQVLQARAYCLIGDCNMELKNPTEAAVYYKKAANYKPNKFATPGYLMKLATAYTEAKDSKSALETYTTIAEDYPLANESLIAKKYKSRLETEAGE